MCHQARYTEHVHLSFNAPILLAHRCHNGYWRTEREKKIRKILFIKKLAQQVWSASPVNAGGIDALYFILLCKIYLPFSICYLRLPPSSYSTRYISLTISIYIALTISTYICLTISVSLTIPISSLSPSASL
jgi:hypothetical protein